MADRKPVVHEMNLLRGIAMVGVLTVHATSSAVLPLKESSLFGLFNALNILALFCVPAFIFLSGFVLFYNYGDKPIGLRSLGAFYKKRLMYIIVPYVLISFMYACIRAYMNFRVGNPFEPAKVLTNYFEDLLKGDAYTHLYYIIITVQLYIVFPLLVYALQKVRRKGLWLVLAGLAIQVAFYYANKYWLALDSKGSYALTYAAPYLLGAYAALRPDKLQQWMTGRIPAWRGMVWFTWAISAVFFVTIWHDNRLGGGNFPSYAFEFGYEAFTLLTIPVLLQVCGWIRRFQLKAVEERLNDLGGLSFGIYLLHPAFLLVYRQLVPLPGMPYQFAFWVAGCFAAGVVGSLIVLLPMYRLAGWSWILFGTAPSKFGKPAKASVINVQSGGGTMSNSA